MRIITAVWEVWLDAGDDRLQNNCKAMLRTFVPQAHSLEDGLGVLDISCGGRAGPVQGRPSAGKPGLRFFSQLKHLILESSEPVGVNLPSLSSFTLAQRTYLRSLYLVSYTANLVTVGDHLCSGLDCPRMTPGAGENILTQPKTDLQSIQMSLWKLKNSHLRAGM